MSTENRKFILWIVAFTFIAVLIYSDIRSDVELESLKIEKFKAMCGKWHMK